MVFTTNALLAFCLLAPSSLEITRHCTCRPHQVLHLSARAGKRRGTATPSENNDKDEASRPAPPLTTPKHWLYPYVGSVADNIKSNATKDWSSKDPGQNATVYNLRESFLREDREWMKYVRRERMGKNAEVLYRTKIVNAIVQQIENLLRSKRKRGFMVKGPLGVGKTYSLINLTKYLLGSGKYWVTIIPDCHKWETRKFDDSTE